MICMSVSLRRCIVELIESSRRRPATDRCHKGDSCVLIVLCGSERLVFLYCHVCNVPARLGPSVMHASLSYCAGAAYADSSATAYSAVHPRGQRPRQPQTPTSNEINKKAAVLSIGQTSNTEKSSAGNAGAVRFVGLQRAL